MIGTSKQQTCQMYIYKIHSSRLRKAKWKLTLTLREARRNGEIVSLSRSQILTWLDELNGIEGADERARIIRSQIKWIRKKEDCAENRREIKRLYEALDELQFKPDYMCLIIDREKDYRRAAKGFTINGLTYHRLLGTNGGVKNHTIVFIADRHGDEIRRRIDNGRNLNQAMVPAKFEAYKALTCSACNQVSMPHGVLVVKDCETEFQSDVIYLNDEAPGDPVMTYTSGETVNLDATDGCGMISPALAERWSEELKLGYTMSGGNLRFSFAKGMAFTFDFVDFAEKVAGTYIVRDAWGDEVDVRQVELVMTTSMLKLWDSYPSCAEYLRNCFENHYVFGVAKVCPDALEDVHTTNYQFLQSLDLTEQDIDELIQPTMDRISDVLGGDVMKTLIFLKGSGLNDQNIKSVPNDFAKALMIDQSMVNDPYVQSSIYRSIKNRINQAKVGVLDVHGNYSIASGDLYALCQSMFGLPVTGLLKAGEIYNKYWIDQGAEDLLCFRAPMTCLNNIRRVSPCYSEEAAYWFRYMKTCTVFNAWDTCCAALNGMD